MVALGKVAGLEFVIQLIVLLRERISMANADDGMCTQRR